MIVVPPPPPPPSPRRPRWPSLPLRDGTLSTLKIRRRRWFPSGRSSADGFLRRIQRQRRNRRSGFTDGASWTDLVATTMLVAFPSGGPERSERTAHGSQSEGASRSFHPARRRGNGGGGPVAARRIPGAAAGRRLPVARRRGGPARSSARPPSPV